MYYVQQFLIYTLYKSLLLYLTQFKIAGVNHGSLNLLADTYFVTLGKHLLFKLWSILEKFAKFSSVSLGERTSFQSTAERLEMNLLCLGLLKIL